MSGEPVLDIEQSLRTEDHVVGRDAVGLEITAQQAGPGQPAMMNIRLYVHVVEAAHRARQAERSGRGAVLGHRLDRRHLEDGQVPEHGSRKAPFGAEH